MRIRTVLWTVFWASHAGWASAQGIPVFDAQTLAQSTIVARSSLEQAEELGKLYAKQVEELAVAYQQRDALRGARGLARLLNGPQEQAARRSAPSTWQAVLDAVSSNQFPEFARELQSIYRRIREDGDLADAVEVFGAALQSTAARSYDRAQRTTLANLALSEKAYNDSARRIDAYERLIEEIDRTPDLKASSDLVARLLAENGLALNELIRMQSLLLESASNAQAAALSNRARFSEIAHFDEERYRRFVEQRPPNRFAKE
jgi:Type IV secretion system proteins